MKVNNFHGPVTIGKTNLKGSLLQKIMNVETLIN